MSKKTIFISGNGFEFDVKTMAPTVAKGLKIWGFRGRRMPQKGEIVKIDDWLKRAPFRYGKVAYVNEKGHPTKLELPNGEIISVVGLILELVGLIQKLILAISNLFKRKDK